MWLQRAKGMVIGGLAVLAIGALAPSAAEAGWVFNPVVGWVYVPDNPYAAARRQGYREGQIYWETGWLPNRAMSPAELQGFYAGEQRAASIPWQYDPVRQRGYREGRLYWGTGLVPRRPMSPAELQGFYAGQRRAAFGPYGP